MAKKNPFADEDVNLTTDPDSLYTGGGSQMFGNERLEPRKTKQAKADQARQQSEIKPIATDLLKKIASMKANLGDVGSYLTRIYAENNAPKIDPKQIEIEFRSRELTLQYIQELESWILMRTRNQ